jgi:hypothetical protein
MSCFEIRHLGSAVEESTMLDQPFLGKLQFWISNVGIHRLGSSILET